MFREWMVANAVKIWRAMILIVGTEKNEGFFL